MEAAQEESSSDTLQRSDLFGIKHIANVPREYKNLRKEKKKRKLETPDHSIRARKDKTTWARTKGCEGCQDAYDESYSFRLRVSSQSKHNLEKSNF